MLKDPEASVREAAARVLARHVNESARAAAVGALDDPDASVRYTAALHLHGDSARPFVPRLIEGLQDDNHGVRVACAKSLKIIGSSGTAGDDTVHQSYASFCRFTHSVMTFVPNDATGSAYFLLLADYPQPFNWATHRRLPSCVALWRNNTHNFVTSCRTRCSPSIQNTAATIERFQLAPRSFAFRR